MGKELGDFELLGKFVWEYFLVIGDKDFFNCRCKMVECECIVIVDEGFVYIVFVGLERKMNWDDEKKLVFFRSVIDMLWVFDVLNELGNFIDFVSDFKVVLLVC